MRPLRSLLHALEVTPSGPEFQRIATAAGVSLQLVKYWDTALLAPSDVELKQICQEYGLNPLVVKLRMGLIDDHVRNLLMKEAESFSEIKDQVQVSELPPARRVFSTNLGSLYQGDCLSLMRGLPSGSFNLIFADPPFNINKQYPSKINDALKSEDYLSWCFAWVDECIRLLAEGGSLFIYNLPKWNTAIAEYLNGRLVFRDWIAVDMKFSLPLANRLYPSHYSLLYYAKGERPAAFKPDRLPMKVCPHCFNDLTDYGGYKDKMNPLGVNLTDVWYDIPPVRHKRYKKRAGANELSIKLLDRVIEMASKEGDHIFDPFGGSGSTYVVAEIKNRRWTGIEIGPVEDIVARFEDVREEAEYLRKFREDYNCLFTPKIKSQRQQLHLWTAESVKKNGHHDTTPVEEPQFL
ncbi:MAG TPA: site-specific DNA-methyltransferase [Verrucomicrobiae bacterium]